MLAGAALLQPNSMRQEAAHCSLVLMLLLLLWLLPAVDMLLPMALSWPSNREALMGSCSIRSLQWKQRWMEANQSVVCGVWVADSTQKRW
jgi:hypothetical protein